MDAIEAIASDIISDDDYDEFVRDFHERFDGERVMHGYLIMRIFSARLERLMGIPPVVVDLGEDDE